MTETAADQGAVLAEVSRYLAEADERQTHFLGVEMSVAYRRLMLGEIGPTEYAEEVKASESVSSARISEAEDELRRTLIRWLEAEAICSARVSRRPTAGRFLPGWLTADSIVRRAIRHRPARGGFGTMVALSWRLVLLPLVASLGVAFMVRQSVALFTDDLYIQVWQLWPVVLLLLGVSMLLRESREPDFLPLIKRETD